VISLENGESALQSLALIVQKAQSNKQDPNNVSTLPDVIISDVLMPGGMDERQLLQSRRSSVSLMNIPVFFLTAKGMTKDRIEGYNSGADAYILNPFDPEELVTIVENLI
jgi:DNA-binding response OmpR family regulator